MDLISTVDLNIKLLQSDIQNPGFGGAEVQIDVVDSENIQPEIFVFQKDVKSEFSPAQDSFFWSIASCYQLSAFPKDEPAEDGSFFLRSSLIQTFEAVEDADIFIKDVKIAIRKLLDANDIIINEIYAQESLVRLSATGEEIIE